MDSPDYDTFAGVESKTAMICDQMKHRIYIMDHDKLHVIEVDSGEEKVYELNMTLHAYDNALLTADCSEALPA
tara:strand:- start:1445 stop:1663 length:219 start_codon:yes stop_codon:yes gene_type:complete